MAELYNKGWCHRGHFCNMKTVMTKAEAVMRSAVKNSGRASRGNPADDEHLEAQTKLAPYGRTSSSACRLSRRNPDRGNCCRIGGSGLTQLRPEALGQDGLVDAFPIHRSGQKLNVGST